MTEFRKWVVWAREACVRKSTVVPVPSGILEMAEPTDYELPSVAPGFPDKFAIGRFCCSLIPDADYEKARSDVEMWTWLAARYFDEITKGRTKIKEPRAYIASIDYQEFYRHLILGPYFIYFGSREVDGPSRVLLYDEPTTMNEVFVQFGSYQTLFQNTELQKLVDRIYFDTRRRRIKRGAGGKTGGAPRRFMAFLRQIELNYDLESITAESMWEMLPREFDRFK